MSSGNLCIHLKFLYRLIKCGSPNMHLSFNVHLVYNFYTYFTIVKRRKLLLLIGQVFDHSSRNMNPLQPLNYFRFCLCDSMVVCLNKWQEMWLLLGRPPCSQVPAYFNVFIALRVITNTFSHTYKPVTQHCASCLFSDLLLVSNLSLRNPEFTELFPC